jgi:muramoyltetrapeptide carboxypeptidase
MNKPKVLSKGDTVAIIAPSSFVDRSNIEKIEKFVVNIGLKPIFLPSCYERHGHFAGMDKVRAKDVNDAFENNLYSGIICIRGGYGTPRILNMLDYEMIKKNPKFFLGYSDITGIHTVLNDICNMVTYHGPMAYTEELFDLKDDYTLNSLKRVIYEDSPLGRYQSPEGEELEIINEGKASGIIAGGNLSLLVSTLGSEYEIDTRDKILFIEDVDELNYSVDRMLISLDLAGKFKDCKGVVLGTWKGCRAAEFNDGSRDLSLGVIFEEILGKYDMPVFNNFRAGHVYPQFTIPLGSLVEIDTESKSIVFK